MYITELNKIGQVPIIRHVFLLLPFFSLSSPVSLDFFLSFFTHLLFSPSLFVVRLFLCFFPFLSFSCIHLFFFVFAFCFSLFLNTYFHPPFFLYLFFCLFLFFLSRLIFPFLSLSNSFFSTHHTFLNIFL